MSATANNPNATPDPEGAPNQPDSINPGYGASLVRMPEWFRQRTPGQPLTPAEQEQLSAALRPLIERVRRQRDQYPDRQAILAALPEWMYAKLPTNEPITPADRERLRAEFAAAHPELAARLDPVEVVSGWRYGRWYETNHGRPSPDLPPRSTPVPRLPE